MKKMLILVLLWFTMLGIYAQADSSISLPLEESIPPVKPDRPKKGNRMPAQKETCVIDFVNVSIRSTILNEIISYELWDETGEYIVMTYWDDADMVEFISTLTGCYQLRLVTVDTSYTGYIAVP